MGYKLTKDITLKEFLKEVKEYNPKADLKLIEKAFNLSKKLHESQKRDSGEPYHTHPVEVCRILMQLNVDSATLCAALLHDVLENTKIKPEIVEKEFGKEVLSLVQSLTNIDKFKFESREEYTNENIRKVLLASSKDIRVILIKLADRLHNMRTLKFSSPEKQQRIARNTLDVFAPIAEKLGVWFIKGELEDLALRHLEPDTYDYLKSKIGEKREEREKKTQEIVKFLQDELEKNSIKARVFGRAKYFYSIYKKMQRKQKDFGEVFDLIGIRVITSNEDECYAALNLVHSLWPHKKTRLKDYIKYPKDNGYQSLHTTVYGPYNKVLEIQIRSLKMHYDAEDGVAAHWRYIGTERDKEFDRRIQWFKQAIEWRRFTKNAQEFIENLRMDFYENEIVVLTPKGDPITIKEGSTPLDFAYEVHTSIGNHCAGAQVNGKAVPLNYKLKSGEIVNIITKKNANPSSSWLKIVTSNRARQKIKHALGLTTGGKVNKELIDKARITNEIEAKDPSLKAIFRIAQCCKPELNDPIVGLLTKEDIVMVHKVDCPNISIFEKKSKIVDVSWKIKKRESLTNRFRIKLKERVGLFAEILNVFAEHGLHLEYVNSKVSKEHVYLNILCKRTTPEKLKEISSRIKAIPNVISIFVE